LEGKKLAVFGQRRYQDKLHLILILPQGGRSLVPKEWTDLEVRPRDSPTQAKTDNYLGSIGSVHDLLHARAVVDSSIAAPQTKAAAKHLPTRRTPIVQRMLNFLDIPIPERQLWETPAEEPQDLGYPSPGTTDRPSDGLPSEIRGRS
jgi:hypothetical protein